MGTSQSSKGQEVALRWFHHGLMISHSNRYPRRKKGGLRHFENRWEMRYQMEIEQISEKP